MNTEKRNSLMAVGLFSLGLFGGWLLGSIAPVNGLKQTHIKAEYYLELRPNDLVIIEDCAGNTIKCKTDDIPAVLLRDNL